MKATDLMIGDWVQIKDILEYRKKGVPVCQPLIVYSLYRGTITLGIEERAEVMVTEDKIEPIPLTPEILEKNGFRWTGSGDSTGMLSTPWGFDGIRYNIYVGLKKKTIEVHSAHPELRTDSWRKVNKVLLEVCGCFVHELQHALRLCGIEKEIEL